MLEVTHNNIEKFVDTFLQASNYQDLSSEQFGGLRNFLIQFMEKLYNENANAIISLLEQLDNINPFMIKLALSYGILEEDVTNIVRVLFMKINEYFYEQGSFVLIKNLKKIFDYYGIKSSIYKVIYDKVDDIYVLENVETGERSPAPDNISFTTPGHLLTKDDYAVQVLTSEYETIVIYIDFETRAAVSDKMQNPVALLHAYSITTHKNDIVPFYINGQTFDLTLRDFLDFYRYYYLRYIKFKNPDFDLDESGLEMWSLFITDDQDLEDAKQLLITFLDGGYMSRDGLAYYLRVSTRILNKYKFQTTPRSYDEIQSHVYSLNQQLAEQIDSLDSVDKFINNINIMLLYLEQYIDTLSQDTTLDKYVRDTIWYLFMHVVVSIISSLEKQVKSLTQTYKRYYLPIYTQFIFNDNNSLKIRNEFLRVFIDDLYNILVNVNQYDHQTPEDDHLIQILKNQKDRYVDVLDSFFTVIGSRVRENQVTDDKYNLKIFFLTQDKNLADDIGISSAEQQQFDNTDIIDSVTITITSNG